MVFQWFTCNDDPLQLCWSTKSQHICFLANNARQPKTNMGLSDFFKGKQNTPSSLICRHDPHFLGRFMGKHVIFRDTQISYISKTYPKTVGYISTIFTIMVIVPRIFHGISLRNETAMVPTSGSSRTGRIGMVLLNASLMARWYTPSVSGFEYRIGGV